jgi:hypothetical protein
MRAAWGFGGRKQVGESNLSRPYLGVFPHRQVVMRTDFGIVSFDFLQFSQGRAWGFLEEEEHRVFQTIF